MNEEREETTGSLRRFYWILALILVAGFLVRFGYVVAQPESDPHFAAPTLDGAYYLEWARSITGDPEIDGTRFEGAFYLAPLYPYLLALFLELFGSNFGLLYYLQHLLAIATAALLALQGRRWWGAPAALVASGLLLLYHPLLFFSSRPLGEALSIFLLVSGLGCMGRQTLGGRATAGLLVGLATLARPNLALVAVAWTLGELLLRRWKLAAVLVAGFGIAVLPVGLRNLTVSGHFVPVSANSGMTLYHGNGPGAQGLFGPLPAGLSGDVQLQRDEATRLASLERGEQLDAVEADAHWRAKAVSARWSDPWGTLRLGLRRVLLTLDNRESGLDYDPNLDANPWRRLAPLPFALLVGLAAAGFATRGVGGRHGWPTTAAILACAATPVVFYVSSRYRLPLAALLCVPAAWTLGALRLKRLLPAAVALVVAALLAWTVPLIEPAVQRLLATQPDTLAPYKSLRSAEQVESLVSQGAAFWRTADLDAAEQRARRALALSPASSRALDLLGVVLEARGRTGEAEASYRKALGTGSDVRGRVSAATNLAALLIRRDEPHAAIPILREALELLPLYPLAWNNLLVAQFNAGEPVQAGETLQRARAAGVQVDPRLAAAIEAATVPGAQEQAP